ncbi:hypothetical protein TELCIR_17472, partial [Teladorsagia circumcincta]
GVFVEVTLATMKFDEFLFTYLGEMGNCALPTETKQSPYLTDDPRFSVKDCRDWNENPVSVNESESYGVHCYYNEICDLDGVECETHVYDRSRVKYSAMDRWDITCARGNIRATVQACYYLGQMIGSMVFGMLGDSAGLGFSHPGIFVIAVVIGAELVGPRYRKLAAVITGGFFAIGQVLLGIEGYFLTDYRLVPESARWLVTQRRFDDADKVLRKAAKMNGEVLPEKW